MKDTSEHQISCTLSHFCDRKCRFLWSEMQICYKSTLSFRVAAYPVWSGSTIKISTAFVISFYRKRMCGTNREVYRARSRVVYLGNGKSSKWLGDRSVSTYSLPLIIQITSFLMGIENNASNGPGSSLFAYEIFFFIWIKYLNNGRYSRTIRVFFVKTPRRYNKVYRYYNYWLKWGGNEDLSTLKSDIHRGRKADLNITFKGRWILMSTEIEANIFLKPIILFYNFSTINENVLLLLLSLKPCST